ncbi:NAD-dependent epimerase/dehydratase family protein [Solirubrobacter soli]|uniref:NAD-dependent epimerase/dehydratase family protein n=1 Tax=Solirubrobacter soli TaxID=363832 RepID=UPI00146A03B1|nr:NAD(P)-dependent oxidoreductase [Solirubrobacter soli]
MQRVVVTGGLGFIGSHVVDALLAAGRQVTIIDSMVAAVTDGREYEHVAAVHRVSIHEYLQQGGTFADTDLVVHAASHVGPAGILRYQGSLGADIVAVTQEVIEECVAHDVALISFSSAEVYGRSGMLAEGDDIIVPTHYNARLEYAIAKTLTEAATINSRHRGLRGFVIRPFNVVGPRQSRAGGFVMPTFVQQALAGRPLTVFAGGGQERAFLSASDLARFITDHADAAFDSQKPIFNVGNPLNTITVWNLAERIVQRLASASAIEHTDARLIHGPLYEEAESIQKLPVLDAAASVGWAPAITLDELIDETALYYRVRDDAREAQAVPLDPGVRV